MVKFIKLLNLLFVFVIVLMTHSCYKPVPKEGDKTHLSKVVVQTDTLRVAVSPVSKQEGQNNMPWVAALIIGVLTVVINYVIARINRSTSLSNLDKQTETSLKLASQQIESSRDIAIENIRNSQQLAIKQFNGTLKSNNRQEWVNELRNTISDLLANCKHANIEFQDPAKDQKRIKELLEKVSISRNKVLLLLDPEHKEKHKKLYDDLSKFIDTLDEHLLNSKHDLREYKNWEFLKEHDQIIESTRLILYHEWQKIQEYR